MCATRSHRPGWTLIELLVVMAIIAILISLLLSAVQKVREAANRMRCLSNLKQIGLALHNCHDAFGHFPPGHTWAPPGYDTRGSESTWVTHLLPYLEQDNLYRRIDWTRGLGFSGLIPNHPNAPVTSAALSLFCCPSDDQAAPYPVEPTREVPLTGAYARGNYAANNGLGPLREFDVASRLVGRP